eukprot:scaffold85510_cov17-Tisochrysis_lutea.AAC.1
MNSRRDTMKGVGWTNQEYEVHGQGSTDTISTGRQRRKKGREKENTKKHRITNTLTNEAIPTQRALGYAQSTSPASPATWTTVAAGYLFIFIHLHVVLSSCSSCPSAGPVTWTAVAAGCFIICLSMSQQVSQQDVPSSTYLLAFHPPAGPVTWTAVTAGCPIIYSSTSQQ